MTFLEELNLLCKAQLISLNNSPCRDILQKFNKVLLSIPSLTGTCMILNSLLNDEENRSEIDCIAYLYSI